MQRSTASLVRRLGIATGMFVTLAASGFVTGYAVGAPPPSTADASEDTVSTLMPEPPPSTYDAEISASERGVRRIRVTVRNLTRTPATAGFAGDPDSRSPISGREAIETWTRSLTVTLGVETQDGGKCWYYVTSDGTLTAEGDPLRPTCRFEPS